MRVFFRPATVLGSALESRHQGCPDAYGMRNEIFTTYTVKRMANQENRATLEQVLPIMRLGLVGGVVFFGAVAWWMAHMQGGIAPDLVDGIQGPVWIGLGVLFLALFAAVVALRSRRQSAEDGQAKHGATIMGWAVAESGGLIGCIYLLFVGDPTFFGVGLAFLLLATFVLLPIPDVKQA